MKVTRATCPADVMIEGRPEVEIVAFGVRRPAYAADGRGSAYAKKAPGLFGWAGGSNNAEDWGYINLNLAAASHVSSPVDDQGNTDWGRLVPRVAEPAFDPALPIVAERSYTTTPVPYTLVGTYIPADGSEAIYRVKRDEPGTDPIDILASTGRTVDRRGAGSALRFRNAPKVDKYSHTFVFNNNVVSVNLTLTDGEVTDVTWVK